jgi:hypothetical protein
MDVVVSHTQMMCTHRPLTGVTQIRVMSSCVEGGKIGGGQRFSMPQVSDNTMQKLGTISSIYFSTNGSVYCNK